MLMTANLPCCAWAVNVTANASTGQRNTFFTVRLLISKIILFYPIRPALECPANGKAEHSRALGAIRQHRSDGADGVVIGGRVREIRLIGYNGRGQSAFKAGGIVSPIDAEWGVHNRHQNLEFQTGGSA